MPIQIKKTLRNEAIPRDLKLDKARIIDSENILRVRAVGRNVSKFESSAKLVPCERTVRWKCAPMTLTVFAPHSLAFLVRRTDRNTSIGGRLFRNTVENFITGGDIVSWFTARFADHFIVRNDLAIYTVGARSILPS